MTIERNGRVYAGSTFLGDQGDNFFNKPVEERALDLAWSEGCPLGPDLCKPIEEGGRGAGEMEKRYGELTFWFGHLTQELISLGKSDIAEKLKKPRPRETGEVLGTHTKGWIPNELNGMVFRDHAGYVLPRLLIEYTNRDPEKKSDRLFAALDVFKNTAKAASTETELVVGFAEALVTINSDQTNKELKPILKRLLGVGKLKEDNLRTSYRKILKCMEHCAPNLWKCYSDMGMDERSALNIYSEV